MFDQFEKMEKINLLEGEDDLGSDSCPCSCHPAPGNLLRGIVNWSILARFVVQLNEYETDPYFHQLGQNMVTNCLFTFVFSPFLPVLRQKLFCFDVQNNFRHKTGKNGEKHKSKQAIACHVLA